MEMKICEACKIAKPVSDFYFRKERGEYRGACKKCKSVTIHSDDQTAAQQLLHDFIPGETIFANTNVWNTLFDLISYF